MKHVIYEDPISHRFVLVRLPDRFVEGDRLPILPTDPWFETHEDALAALPQLLDRDE
ncbi:MAG: hypothetical protein ABI868_22470 [Acidobacteriota bacterium]